MCSDYISCSDISLLYVCETLLISMSVPLLHNIASSQYIHHTIITFEGKAFVVIVNDRLWKNFCGSSFCINECLLLFQYSL